MVRALFLLLMVLSTSLVLPADALASTIAVVDFRRALEETDEGKAKIKQIEQLYATRQSEITKMEDDLQKDLDDYQAREMIMSEEARQESQQGLLKKQQRYYQKLTQYQSELQQAQITALSELDEKMRRIVDDIATEKAIDLVLDASWVVHVGAKADDITDELIRRYNKL